MLATAEVVAESQGVGGATLLHVPLTVDVPNLEATEEGSDDAANSTKPSPVIIEARLDETKSDVPVALRSVRPYHYPSGQEGSVAPSYLDWTLTTLCGGYGVSLQRDRTIEERERMTRQAWEDKQEGRKQRATSKRSRYKALHPTEADLAAKVEAMVAKNAIAGEAGKAVPEENEEVLVIPDGLAGLDEEETRIAMERRAKMDSLPPITLRSHVVLGKATSPRGKKNKRSSAKTHYVSKPSKYLDGVVSTSTDTALEGMSKRSQMRTEMLIEQGRRVMLQENQLKLLREKRAAKMARLKKAAQQRAALLFPTAEKETTEDGGGK